MKELSVYIYIYIYRVNPLVLFCDLDISMSSFLLYSKTHVPY